VEAAALHLVAGSARASTGDKSLQPLAIPLPVSNQASDRHGAGELLRYYFTELIQLRRGNTMLTLILLVSPSPLALSS